VSPEDQFIATIVKYIALTFLSLAALGIGSCQASKYQMRMVLEGTSTPIAAKCAFLGDTTSGSCLLLYAAEAEKMRN